MLNSIPRQSASFGPNELYFSSFAGAAHIAYGLYSTVNKVTYCANYLWQYKRMPEIALEETATQDIHPLQHFGRGLILLVPVIGSIFFHYYDLHANQQRPLAFLQQKTHKCAALAAEEYLKLNNKEKAISSYQEAIKRAGNRNEGWVRSYCVAAGDLLMSLEKYEEAAAQYNKIERSLFSNQEMVPIYEKTAEAYLKSAAIYLQNHECTEVLQCHKEAIDVSRKTHLPDKVEELYNKIIELYHCPEFAKSSAREWKAIAETYEEYAFDYSLKKTSKFEKYNPEITQKLYFAAASAYERSGNIEISTNKKRSGYSDYTAFTQAQINYKLSKIAISKVHENELEEKIMNASQKYANFLDQRAQNREKENWQETYQDYRNSAIYFRRAKNLEAAIRADAFAEKIQEEENARKEALFAKQWEKLQAAARAEKIRQERVRLETEKVKANLSSLFNMPDKVACAAFLDEITDNFIPMVLKMIQEKNLDFSERTFKLKFLCNFHPDKVSPLMNSPLTDEKRGILTALLAKYVND